MARKDLPSSHHACLPFLNPLLSSAPALSLSPPVFSETSNTRLQACLSAGGHDSAALALQVLCYT